MHRDFAEWYRIASLEPDGEELRKRWHGIEQFLATNREESKILEITRYFLTIPRRQNDVIERFQLSFQEADPAFKMRDNELELSVLAGGTIAQFFESSNSDFADVLALAVACADCRGLRSPVAVPEIIDLARAHLKKRSAQLRTVNPEPAIAAPARRNDSASQMNTAAEGNDFPSFATLATAELKALAETITNVATTTQKTILQMARVHSLQQEEIDMLWWLFGGYSHDMEMPMTELPLPFATILAGKELADLTRVLPGPLSARAFLDRMLEGVEPGPQRITLKDAVNATNEQWTGKWLEASGGSAMQDFCPVHISLYKATETGSGDRWVEAFERIVPVRAGELAAPVDLAFQVYQECLLLRSGTRQS